MGQVGRESIDRYSTIVMGGIAAEAIKYGRAEGGKSDEDALIRFLGSLGGGTRAWDGDRIKEQARIGAAGAVKLLRENDAAWERLIVAMEEGESLGECVAIIERGAVD